MKVCLQIVKNEKFKKSKSQKFKMWYNRQKKVGKIIVKQCLSIEYNNFDKNCFYQSYYIMSKKIYARRFSTDCFSDFFTTKALRSSIGINDLEEYKTEKATFEELQQQNSYFISDLMNKHQIEQKEDEEK